MAFFFIEKNLFFNLLSIILLYKYFVFKIKYTRTSITRTWMTQILHELKLFFVSLQSSRYQGSNCNASLRLSCQVIYNGKSLSYLCCE